MDIPDDSHSAQTKDSSQFRFDRSVSIGNILSILVLLVAIISAYNNIIRAVDKYNRSQVRTDVMWRHFITVHPDESANSDGSLR